MGHIDKVIVTTAGLLPYPLDSESCYFQTDRLSIDWVSPLARELPFSRQAANLGDGSPFYSYGSSYFFNDKLFREHDEVLIVVADDLKGFLNLCLSSANIDSLGQSARDRTRYSVVSSIDSPPKIKDEYPFDAQFAYLWSVFSGSSTLSFLHELNKMKTKLFDVDKVSAAISFKLPVQSNGQLLCSPLDHLFLKGIREGLRFEKVLLRMIDYIDHASNLEGLPRMNLLRKAFKHNQIDREIRLDAHLLPPVYFGSKNLYENPRSNGYLVAPSHDLLFVSGGTSKGYVEISTGDRSWLDILTL